MLTSVRKMDNGAALMGDLIRTLENVEHSLLEISNERIWKECFHSKKKTRGYENLKGILEALVLKTIENKDFSNDIISDINKTTFPENMQFENLIKSDEYLEKTKKMLTAAVKPNVVYQYLLTFLELLGDLLYCVCQISNHRMMFPSRILVKDLVAVKCYYVSIWNSLNDSCLSKNKEKMCINRSKLNRYLEKPHFQNKIDTLKTSLQASYKELAKVKLEIEHYLKFNFIEIEFSHLTNYTIPKKTKNNIPKLKNIGKQACQLNQKETTCISDNSQNSECSFKLSPPSNENIFKPPSVLFPEAAEEPDYEYKNMDTFLLSSTTEQWKNWNDHKPRQKSCGDFSSPPLLYPPDSLFCGPNSRTTSDSSTSSASLQVSYSAKSFNSRSKGLDYQTQCSESEDLFLQTDDCNNSKDRIFEESTQITDNCMRQPRNSENNSKGKLLTNDFKNPDLFKGIFCLDNNDSQMEYFKDKLTLIFKMLEGRQNKDIEDIFIETPTKIENKDLFCPVSQDTENNHITTKIKSFEKENINNINFSDRKNAFTSLHYLRDKVDDSKNQYTAEKSTCYKGFNAMLSKDEVFNEIPVKLKSSDASEIIYDERSVIELFKKTQLNHHSNSGSGFQDAFTLWPVTADYIYVSNYRATDQSNVNQSEHSILSSDKCLENALYPYQLNENNDKNERGDKQNMNTLKNHKDVNTKGVLSLPLLNQPYIVNKFTIDGLKYNNKCPGQNYSIPKPNNQVLAFQKGIILKNKKIQGPKHPMFTKYSDYNEPFFTLKSSELVDSFDLKTKEHDTPNNWNSFISIFTSEVGPSTRINHHRMFRHIVNKMGKENMFSNVHTLTSNGGPFRLFDLNGYPLTDSAGNVLKDPYDKSVVHLDSTGLPKDGNKVFDATGKTQNDINFDPTQKPKTNSIIIKLTDSFKRPLHLFDKYGRPLTDSYGKLLVNIHGRPLLRFDNFGRPITDYRGGPLYTVNGFQWSHKTDDFLLNEQLSSEMLSAKAFDNNVENATGFQREEHMRNDKVLNDSENETITLINKTSEIWIQVENVLQQIPKKREDNQNTFKDGMVIENMSINQKYNEDEIMKSIIFHDHIVKQNKSDENNSKGYRAKNTDWFCIQEMKRDFVDNNKREDTSSPQYNNFIIKSTCSKCILKNHLYKTNLDTPNKLFKSNSRINGCTLPMPDERDLLTKNRHVKTSVCNEVKRIQKVPSSFTFKYDDYLNNLCNQILNNEFDWKLKANSPTKRVLNKDMQVANKSSGNCTILTKSKDKNSLARSKLPIEFKNTQRKSSVNIFKGCNYEHLYKQTQISKGNYLTKPFGFNSNRNILKKELDEVENEIKHNYVQSASLKKLFYPPKEEVTISKEIIHPVEEEATLSKKIICPLKEQGKLSKKIVHPPRKKPTLSINVLNNEDTHFEINVAERILSGFESNLHSSSYNSTSTSNDTNKNSDLNTDVKESLDLKNCIINEFSHVDPDLKNEKYNHSQLIRPEEPQTETLETVEWNNSNLNNSCNKDDVSNPIQKNQLNNHANPIKKAYKEENRHSHENKADKCFECLQKEKLQSKKTSKNKAKQNEESLINDQPKNIVTENREYNLVSILGNPVKYVLDKLENRRSSKQNNRNKLHTIVTNTKTNKKSKYIKRKGVQTLYNNSKYAKKESNSSNEKTQQNKSKPTYKHNGLLDFKSSSCANILNLSDELGPTMSYSGNSDKMKNKLSKNLVPCSKVLRKCTSETSYVNQDNYPLQRGRRSRHTKQAKENKNTIK